LKFKAILFYGFELNPVHEQNIFKKFLHLGTAKQIKDWKKDHHFSEINLEQFPEIMIKEIKSEYDEKIHTFLVVKKTYLETESNSIKKVKEVFVDYNDDSSIGQVLNIIGLKSNWFLISTYL
jgi:hypothetical protein